MNYKLYDKYVFTQKDLNGYMKNFYKDRYRNTKTTDIGV